MKKIKINLNGNKLLSFVLLLLLFEPNIFVKYTLINGIYIFGAVISFFIILIIYIRKRVQISKILIPIIAWRVSALITTIVAKNGDVLKCGYQSLILISLFMYAGLYAKNDNIDEFINYLMKLFGIYLIINLITYIYFPKGLYDTGTHTQLYFLGIRTRFTEYAIAEILLAYLNYRMKKIGFIKLVFYIAISTANIILPSVATAMTGVLLIVLNYIILGRIFVGKENYSFKSLFFISLGIVILIVFFRIQNVFSFLIVDVLHKSLTLTNRIYIWDNAFIFIKKGNLLFGNGYVNDGNFIPYGVRVWQAHNQLLQLLYEVGIIGTLAFYYSIFQSFEKIKRKIDKNDILIVSVLFAFLIMMTTEIYSYYIAFYVVVICCFYKNGIHEHIEGRLKNEEQT